MRGQKHLLSIADLKPAELEAILDKAAGLKKKLKEGEPHELLGGKTLGMIFAKPSTRTRVSFETAMTQLGGHAIYLGMSDLQLGRGETIADTARTLSRYVDAVMARLFKHENIIELSRYSNVPVINGLTDLHHPCQTLADLLTIREQKGKLHGLKVAWVGDGNNVCNSLLLGSTLVGINISAACPKDYEPPVEIVKQARANAKKSGAKLEVLNDPKEAVAAADVVYTDVFVSMGQEAEAEQRLKIFLPTYQVNKDLLEHAKSDAIVLHCLPWKLGQEITEDVAYSPQCVAFDQAENRLHTAKSILTFFLR
ncbi:MAG: ornithine carbamoyltransferase [Candidatus Hadarchaeota archaeon]|nr:ornithine carbamoyltransferase [Candidatus Hadarchaeota archaeon]